MESSPALRPPDRPAGIHRPPLRLLLILAWLLVVASAWLWLPAHQGTIESRDGIVFLPLYVGVAALAVFGVRGRANSVQDALVAALPALGLIATAAVSGVLMNEQDEEVRGGPIYLWAGVAQWASWASLVVATAVASRTKWSGAAGISATALVTLAGWVLFVAQVD